MRDRFGPLTVAVAVATCFGCAQMRSPGLDVDMALSRVAPPSAIAVEPPKAMANAPAKVDPIPSLVTVAKPSDIQPVGAVTYPQRPPTKRPAYRTVDGHVAHDGVYELAAVLRVGTRSLIEVPARSAEHTTLEPVPSLVTDDRPATTSEAPPGDVPPPPADIIAESQSVLATGRGVPIPRAALIPADVASAAPASERPGESLVARVVPRAIAKPNPLGLAPTDSEGLALTGTSEIRSDELLELLAGKIGRQSPNLGEDSPVDVIDKGNSTLVATAAATDSPSPPLPVERQRDETAPAALDFVPEPPALASDPLPSVPTNPAADAPSEKPNDGLALDHFHLCREILGFGITTPMTGPVAPGQQLLAYVEVLDSEAREVDGLFETRMACRIAVEDKNGTVVAEQDFGQITDRCYARRKDFFCHFVFTLPGDLVPGPYKLRLFAMDTSDMARAEGCLDFEVRSPAASKEGGEP